MSERTVPAEHFVDNIAANVDNERLSDREFREYVRNTLPIVIYPLSDKYPTLKKEP